MPLKSKLALALALYSAVKNRNWQPLAWNTKLARHYWLPNGLPVKDGYIEENLTKYMDHVQARTRELGEMLANEQIGLGTWQNKMRDHLNDMHRAAYMAGRGGREWMEQSDWGRVGGFIGAQNNYLDTFANQIASGQCTPAEIAHRSGQYGKSGWGTYHQGQHIAKNEAGYTEEIREAVMDHNTCASCARHAARGWQPFGTLPRPGQDCECGVNCRCEMRYRNSELERWLPTEEAVAQTTGPHGTGGYTYDCINRYAPKEGYAVGVAPDRTIRVPAREFNEQHVAQYVNRNRDLLIDYKGEKEYKLGTWWNNDPKTGDDMVYLDCSSVFKHEPRVIQIAAQHSELEYMRLDPLKFYKTEEGIAKLQKMWEMKGWRAKYGTWENFIEQFPRDEQFRANFKARFKAEGGHFALAGFPADPTAEDVWEVAQRITRKVKGEPDRDEPIPDSFKRDWEKSKPED